MSHIIDNLVRILSHQVLVHIYSSPNFLMETCISLLMCVVHCLLIGEVNDIINGINVLNLKVPVKQSAAEIKSKRSSSKGIVRNHPELGIDVVFRDSILLQRDWDTTTKINKILSTSLSEYLRHDATPENNSPITAAVRHGDQRPTITEEVCHPETPNSRGKSAFDELKKNERTEILHLH